MLLASEISGAQRIGGNFSSSDKHEELCSSTHRIRNTLRHLYGNIGLDSFGT